VEGRSATTSTPSGHDDANASDAVVSTTTCCCSVSLDVRKDSMPRRTSSGHPSTSHWIDSAAVRSVAIGTSCVASRSSGASLRRSTREPSGASVTE
jgi:hypothetical protein